MRTKLRLGILKIDDNYVIQLDIKVLKDGQARISYQGDITIAPLVLNRTKRIMEDEIHKQKDVIIKTRDRFTGVGEKKGGVLSEATIMEE